MKNLFLCSSALAFLLFSSCDIIEYTADSENNQKIVSAAQAKPEFDILSVKDSAILFNSVIFNNKIEVENGKLLRVEYYMDGDKIGSTSGNDPFVLETYYFNDTEHKLAIRVYTTTGTGSLADKMNQETMVLNKELVVFIENRMSYTEPFIDQLAQKEGRLIISWGEYPFINFQAYLIYSRYYDSQTGSLSEPRLLANIKDRETTEFCDTNYVGGNVRYFIVTKARDTELKSDELYYNYTPVPFIISKAGKADAVISWRKSEYHNYVKNYEIQIGQDSGNVIQYYKKVIIDNPNDTSAVIPFEFGNAFYVKLSINPGKYGSYSQPVQMLNPFPRIKEIENIKQFVNSKDDGIVYLNLKTKIVRYNLTTETILNESFWYLKLCVSPNKKYLMGVRNAYEFALLDPITLERSTVFSIRTLMASKTKYASFSDYGITDEGMIIITAEYNNKSLGTIIFNPFTEKIETEYTPYELELSQFDISGTKDGAALCIADNRKLFRIKDNKIEYLFTYPGMSLYESKFSSDCSMIFNPNDSELGIYSSSGNAKLAVFSNDRFSYPSEDPATGNVGITTTAQYNIVEKNTLKIIRSVPLVPSATASYFLYNNKIYSENGSYYEL